MTSRQMARIAVWGILGILLIHIFPSTAIEAQVDPPLLVYGLGDSVASGHGLSGAVGECERAPGAYPLLATLLLADLGAVEGGHFACSGATTAGLTGQVDQVLADLATRGAPENTNPVIFITIGANDFGWTDIAALAPRFCGSDAEFRTWVTETNDLIKSNVLREGSRLVIEGQAKVIITDYHNPLNTESNFLTPLSLLPNCFLRSLSVADLYLRAEAAMHSTNSMFNDMVVAAGPAPVRLAQVHPNFHGHESSRPLCGTAPPDLADTWIQVLDCFHPNSAGADNFANAVDVAVRQLLSPPAVSITSPADGSVFSSGSTINFQGIASDPEDGDISASIVWTSDLHPGASATGASGSTDLLIDGVHVITATVTDSDSNTATETITITVGP